MDSEVIELKERLAQAELKVQELSERAIAKQGSINAAKAWQKNPSAGSLIRQPDHPEERQESRAVEAQTLGSAGSPMIQAWWVAILVPFAGIVTGIIKAFDPDPEQKRLAGVNLAGALIGVALWVGILIWGLPFVLGGRGGPAYNRGVEAFQNGNWKTAETAFREAVDADPQFAAAWVNLSGAQSNLKDGPGAEASARRAIDAIESGEYGTIPDGSTPARLKAMAYGNLSAALVLQFNVQPAIDAAKEALHLDPSNPKAPNWEAIARLASIPDSTSQ